MPIVKAFWGPRIHRTRSRDFTMLGALKNLYWYLDAGAKFCSILDLRNGAKMVQANLCFIIPVLTEETAFFYHLLK